MLPKNSSEDACDGSGRMCEEQHDADLDNQRPPTPRGREFSFGEYTVGQTIGIGRRGKVKLAWKKDGGHQVALETIKCGPAASDATRKRICCEFPLLTRFSHPNITRLHELLESRSSLVVVQDYIPCGSLAEYIAVHPTLLKGFSLKLSRLLGTYIEKQSCTLDYPVPRSCWTPIKMSF